MKLINAEIRQFEDGFCRPEVALVVEFDTGDKYFSVVGYDIYKTQLAMRGTPEDVLDALLFVLHDTHGTPAQPVCYAYDDELPAEADHRARQSLTNLRNEYIVLAEFKPEAR